MTASSKGRYLVAWKLSAPHHGGLLLGRQVHFHMDLETLADTRAEVTAGWDEVTVTLEVRAKSGFEATTVAGRFICDAISDAGAHEPASASAHVSRIAW